jgi:hypothetical protein
VSYAYVSGPRADLPGRRIGFCDYLADPVADSAQECVCDLCGRGSVVGALTLLGPFGVCAFCDALLDDYLQRENSHGEPVSEEHRVRVPERPRAAP